MVYGIYVNICFNLYCCLGPAINWSIVLIMCCACECVTVFTKLHKVFFFNGVCTWNTSCVFLKKERVIPMVHSWLFYLILWMYVMVIVGKPQHPTTFTMFGCYRVVTVDKISGICVLLMVSLFPCLWYLCVARKDLWWWFGSIVQFKMF